MTITFAILALAMLGALIYTSKAHARERQEIHTQHDSEVRALLHSARLERDAARKQLADAQAAASTAQSELIDRFHVPESKRLAAMQEQWALPTAPETVEDFPPPPDAFAFDPDDYIAGLMLDEES